MSLAEYPAAESEIWECVALLLQSAGDAPARALAVLIFAIIASLSLKDTLIPTVALPGLLSLLAFYLVFWLMIPLGYGYEHLSVPRSTRVHSAPLAPLGSSLLRVPHRQPRV